MIVASAKDKGTRKPLYPVAWDGDVLLMPRVNTKKQNRPTFTDKQVQQIIERAVGQFKMLFAVLAASGLRISELLGLRIENVPDDCYRFRIIEKNYAGRQEVRSPMCSRGIRRAAPQVCSSSGSATAAARTSAICTMAAFKMRRIGWMAERLGTGFVLSCTECTEKEKEATGAVASK
jgi:hypothetical protein